MTALEMDRKLNELRVKWKSEGGWQSWFTMFDTGWP